MKTARGGGAADNLDFLLDAMCNAFGGIIFIGLLLSLLGREAATLPVAAAPDGTLQGEALAAWEAAMTTRGDQLAALENQLETLTQAMGGAAELPADALVEIAQHREAVEEAEREQNDGEARAREVQSLERRLAETRDEISAIEIRRGRLSRRRDQVLAMVRDHERAPPPPRQQIARMPHLQQGRQDPFYIHFEHGKLYWPFSGDGALNHQDNRFEGELEKVLTVFSRPEGGYPVGTAQAPGEAAIRISDEMMRRGAFAQCHVFPDSYEAFSEFREYLSSRGIRYNWEPVTTDTQPKYSSNGYTPRDVQ